MHPIDCSLLQNSSTTEPCTNRPGDIAGSHHGHKLCRGKDLSQLLLDDEADADLHPLVNGILSPRDAGRRSPRDQNGSQVGSVGSEGDEHKEAKPKGGGTARHRRWVVGTSSLNVASKSKVERLEDDGDLALIVVVVDIVPIRHHHDNGGENEEEEGNDPKHVAEGKEGLLEDVKKRLLGRCPRSNKIKVVVVKRSQEVGEVHTLGRDPEISDAHVSIADSNVEDTRCPGG
mmetsp:Transcript_13602/g.34201  ORF Transcript_13602/g.34201 Transcript_13602/m.34201 type:complete len:231 (-) Transcript_13602:744-1436(-)